MDGETRRSRRRWSTGVERRSSNWRGGSRCRASSWFPARRVPAPPSSWPGRFSGARNDGPSRSGARVDPRRPPATVPEPPRGPALGPGAGGRAGRGANRDAVTDRRPARPKNQSRAGRAHGSPKHIATEPTGQSARTREYRRMNRVSAVKSAFPSQVGVRPDTRLSVGFLSQAFALDVRGPAADGRDRLRRPEHAAAHRDGAMTVPAGHRRRARGGLRASRFLIRRISALVALGLFFATRRSTASPSA